MNQYFVTFKDAERYETVKFEASQMNETETFISFVTFSEGDTYSCIRYATHTIFSISEAPIPKQ